MARNDPSFEFASESVDKDSEKKIKIDGGLRGLGKVVVGCLVMGLNVINKSLLFQSLSVL